MATTTLAYFFTDFFGGMLFFPVWWYTRGLKMSASWAVRSVKGASAWFGLGVWVKNLFVPMYGETSIQGRLISFFIRLVMIFFRGFAVFFWAIIVFILFLLYLSLFPLAIVGILYHGAGVIFT